MIRALAGLTIRAVNCLLGRLAAWAEDSARTWPVEGDTWDGHGERVEVVRGRRLGAPGIDVMLINGGEVTRYCATYSQWRKITEGMSLVRWGGA